MNWWMFMYLLGLMIAVTSGQSLIRDREKGALIGKLKTLQHEVRGTVWAIDESTLYLEKFYYDGVGPDAFFWMGTENQPSPRGFIVPYPIGTPNSKQKELPGFQGENIILQLPPGKKISELKYFSVWCRRFTVDFGNVLIPSGLETPMKKVLPEFKRLAHGVRSGNITILDSKTFYIPNLHYDGAGPDAFFWVGKGSQPDPNGQKIPNEIGSYDILRGYEGEDIEIQLPDNLTVYDIDYLSIWCVAYRHDFGHVLIPEPSEMWVPPALGQTRIKSTADDTYKESDRDVYVPVEAEKPHTRGDSAFSNCYQINEDFQVEWQAGNREVQIRLKGRIETDQYLSFGLSPAQDRPEMINADVVVVYYDTKDGSFHAQDYTMSGKAQCDGTFGVCPDQRVRGTNDVSVVSGDRHNGVTSVTYSRPYEGSDRSDISISRSSKPVTIIAAIGPLNTRNEANYHTTFSTKKVHKIDFSSIGINTCSPLAPETKEPEYVSWTPNMIKHTNNFTVTIGPTGGDRGYKAITGNPSWGIALWINDVLIPEIYVVRGQTYHFTIETGDDQTNPSKYHPFYITESPSGGFAQKTIDEQEGEVTYAGVSHTKMGIAQPTSFGRICEWKHKSVDSWKESETFDQYRSTLTKVCEPGLPGHLEWTVTEDTPDTVYYQCYTHQHLGWKIHVHDKEANLPISSSINLKINLWTFLLAVSVLYSLR